MTGRRSQTSTVPLLSPVASRDPSVEKPTHRMGEDPQAAGADELPTGGTAIESLDSRLEGGADSVRGVLGAWPGSRDMSSPLEASQRHTVPSSLALAATLPSGLCVCVCVCVCECASVCGHV